MKQFMEAYGAEKRLKNLVDFNDLEHYTLAILAHIAGSGILSILFAVALLASRQNSTITGTLTGQSIIN